jgi:hypothetical protein
MKYNQVQLSEAASAILTGSFAPQSLQLIHQIIEHGASPALISTLLAIELPAAKCEAGAVLNRCMLWSNSRRCQIWGVS